jgi:hypothetical protein
LTRFPLGTVMTLPLFWLVCGMKAQEPSAPRANVPQARAYDGNRSMEDTEQHLGPFSIRGQNFSVVLHEKRLPGASDPRFAQTLSTLEIRDEKEAVLYEKTFTFGIEKGKLERSLKASASLLSGKYLTGLLISYRLKLSTGEDAEAWQIFGYQDGRYKAQDAKFRIFDKPLRSDYPMGNPPAEMKLVTPTGVVTKPMIPEGETFEFRVWTGNFYVMLPVGVNFAQANFIRQSDASGLAAQSQACMRSAATFASKPTPSRPTPRRHFSDCIAARSLVREKCFTLF